MFDADLKLEYEILYQISKNNLPMGASLLSLKIDASQATIGRKLQELEHKNFLKKESNKGRIITSEGKKYLKKLKNDIIKSQNVKELIKDSNSFSKKRLLDILMVRKILERETVRMATKRITKTQLRRLKKIINLQEIKVSQDLLGDEEDLKFHSLLARISGNKVMEQILTLILTQNGVYSEFSYIRKKLHTSIVKDHKGILNAIEKGDAELAANLMVSHIDKIIDDVNKYFEEKND